ncbi:NADPH-dependent oxidoreductase [Lentilactobacillus hilgardii]|jgi:nitroreductase|uniref:NADPH-dependent oxidoreductase n=1 Tax=Lentilactobacillus hilgardii TaxID=1588 RepID=A0A6P1E9N6_LENHI|nr:NADPH-dependent oxidoreductase [Lentilactobacillus hilgardii]EEI72261.1 nitroreductase family protein [Lentilactobacillus hilgardii ATCC 27305]MCT3392985.1 NADPH-dependent oxidoreductase [Lentilactobacillus hilgardii]QHB50874.1 NADPH-dependent oxidoreductase [Lentilactobacillus hilgardii]RRG08299.1 MAG: NADPH-dependent oxidoreductase [Lactobacillus sp.]
MSSATNPIIEQLLAHRSIRQFKDKTLTNHQIHELIEAAQHASTSTFSQQYSIISVTDQRILSEFAEITGHPWLLKSSHYFVMIADQYRNLQIARKANADPFVLHTTDKFLAAVFDASIATENVMVAAESMGLGATIMGSILNDSKRVIDLLGLPELTFPLLGIAIGYPADQPELKPRLPQEEVHFVNQYQLRSDKTQLKQYDQLLSDYYRSRGSNNRVETFSHHIVSELGIGHHVRADLLSNIKSQGFLISQAED